PDEWLEAPTEIALDGRTLSAIHTPGHTQGHLVYSDDANGMLFAGDHVLPHITPSSGLVGEVARSPLGGRLVSLRRAPARRGQHRPDQDSPRTPSPRWWSRGRLAVLSVVVLALTFTAVRVVTEFRTPPPPSRCTLMVAAMPPRARLAQRLMIGVDGSNADTAV